ncbi:MAG: sigma 54-interacting transcriptional regulator [Myxococcaceae bacterium]|nr:sigma 54-interacting transcriptional regulator [Myxococcaceae bacterium]
MPALRILLVEDDRIVRVPVRDALEDAGYLVTECETGAQAQRLLTSARFDIMLSDVRLPGVDGVTLFRLARALEPAPAVVLMTAFADTEQAVAVMRGGVRDYVLKPFEMDELLLRLGSVRDEVQFRLRVEKARAEGVEGLEQTLVGKSPQLQLVRARVAAAASSQVNVLLLGEPGTGKELAARLIHQASARAGGPLVIVNCAAIPEAQFEAEMFGQAPGSTGTDRRRVGRLEAADGGTLFLDEIDALPLLGPADERTALLATPGVLQVASAEFQRHVVVDLGANAGFAVGDRVVIDLGQPTEEYAQIGRLQTTSDQNGADLGAFDRVYFTTVLRYAHSQGASIQEATLSARREGTDYTISNVATGELTALAGRFTAGNAVVVTYRTDGRFGWKRGPTDTAQARFPAPIADTDEVDQTWGDWKGLPLLDGTYTVAMWANRDFTVTPAGVLTTTQSWDVWTNDNTTYRMMAKPAQRNFLFGAATTVQPRAVISSGDTCNACHNDIAAHGFGRRGLDTCLTCHNSPGVEDGPKFTYSAWFVGATPGATMDFRTLLHRVHAGKELSRPYVVNGVFLGTPYTVTYDTIGFPSFKGGVSECTKCHGATNTAWKQPAERSHPLSPVAVRTWASVCSSCHDSAAAEAHFFVQTYNGNESCAVCHGPGKEFSVELSHKVR